MFIHPGLREPYIQSLAMQARLKVLDLSDNALGEKGVRACAAALSSQVMLT